MYYVCLKDLQNYYRIPNLLSKRIQRMKHGPINLYHTTAFSLTALACQSERSPQSGGHGAEKADCGITVTPPPTLSSHTHTGQPPDKNTPLQNNNEIHRCDSGTISKKHLETLMKKKTKTRRYMSVRHPTDGWNLLKTPSYFTSHGLGSLVEFLWRGHSKFMKQEKKGKMSSKSDSVEYMNNLEHQKICGPWITKKTAIHYSSISNLKTFWHNLHHADVLSTKQSPSSFRKITMLSSLFPWF